VNCQSIQAKLQETAVETLYEVYLHTLAPEATVLMKSYRFTTSSNKATFWTIDESLPTLNQFLALTHPMPISSKRPARKTSTKCVCNQSRPSKAETRARNLTTGSLCHKIATSPSHCSRSKWVSSTKFSPTENPNSQIWVCSRPTRSWACRHRNSWLTNRSRSRRIITQDSTRAPQQAVYYSTTNSTSMK